VRRLAAILGLCSLLAAGSALAAAPSPTNQARLDSTIRYLQEAQNLDGGFGGASGKESGQGFSAWVALALAAAGINPRCQSRPGGIDAYSFLVDHFHEGLEEEISWPNAPTTAFERELMVVNASGTDPHDFAGYDLVAEILARQLPDGSFPYVPGGRGEINDTIFAIVALAPVQEPAAQAAIQRAADWLIAQQDEDGGWSWGVKGDRTEADMAGAAIQALRAAGRPGTDAEQKALHYLHDMQSPDGGFPEFPGETESNVASTAWAVQGIWAAGEDPEEWVTESGNDPLSYMASLQQPDGHIRWKANHDLNGVWMTAYVAPAFAGQAWPIPSSPCDPKQPTTPSEPGQGEGSQSGKGTISGAGGRGAPLFSRPKPQSRGRTPGGARVVHNKSRHPTNHSETRRGSNAKQPSGTERNEPGAMSEPGREYDVAGAAASSGDGGGASSGGGAPASSSATAMGAGSGESGSPEARALSTATRPGGEEDDRREVVGTLVGTSAGSLEEGALAFGAPGLHSAGVDAGGTPWPAIAIGAAALLLGLAGSQLERRRGEAFP
jgi:prenyltransferase beta subunit